MVEISDHPYEILTIGSSKYEKTNTLFNIRGHQPDIDKIILYVKGPDQAKYQLLINNREGVA